MIKVTTDWHLGVKRAAGVTPKSLVALQDYQFSQFKAALDANHDHLIAGDLFNDFTVETSTVIKTFEILADHLHGSGKELVLLRGNHDWQPKASAMSSFDLLGFILKRQFGDQVLIVTEPTEWKQFVLVPHLPNNDIFTLEIDRLSSVTGKVFVFHSNYENNHAAETQHSLNLTREQAESIILRGNKLIIGHEHDHRKLFGGNMIILGNAAPSSVSDCLNSKSKYAAMFDDLTCELIETVRITDIFARADWRQIHEVPADAQFVRIEGEANAEDAAHVIDAIAKLRQNHEAFVITNSVKVDGLAEMDALAELSMDQVTKFDVLGALYEELDEAEREIVGELLKC